LGLGRAVGHAPAHQRPGQNLLLSGCSLFACVGNTVDLHVGKFQVLHISSHHREILQRDVDVLEGQVFHGAFCRPSTRPKSCSGNFRFHLTPARQAAFAVDFNRPAWSVLDVRPVKGLPSR
jgi:hypothetical protein